MGSSLIIRGVRIHFSWDNLLGYAVGRLIQLIEKKDYCHIYPVLVKNDGYQDIAWNIFGWFSRWSWYQPEKLSQLYEETSSWEIALNDDEKWKIQEQWISMKGRQYAVGRLFLLPLYRLMTGWQFLTSPPGITCTAAVAMGLDSIDLWEHSSPPSMAGLREVEEVLLKLKDRKVG